MNLLFLSVPAFPFREDGPVSVLDRLALGVRGLRARGHRCTVLAPRGSQPAPGVVELDGSLHPNADTAARSDFLLAPASVLMAMLEHARRHQDAFDAIVSVGQDYMSLWAQPYFRTPFVVIPSTPYGIPECDALLRRRYQENPRAVGFLTRAHRRAFLRHAGLPEAGMENEPVLWEPFDPSRYAPAARSPDALFWAGRVTPAKGLLTVARVARRLGRRLRFAGVVDDAAYLQAVRETGAEYLGVLARPALAAELARTPVFFQLQAPDWSEAFGRITAEALLCGTPVVALANGANAEVVADGEDGFIVHDADDAIAHFGAACALDGAAIRRRAAARFDAAIHVARLERWLAQVAGAPQPIN